MKTPNLGTAFYAPAPPPDSSELARFLVVELNKIASAITALAAGHLDQTNAAPTRPRDGDIRYADGTNWNPGSGKGFYAYYGAAWHLLG